MRKQTSYLQAAVLLSALSTFCLFVPTAGAVLLVGNTQANNVVVVGETGEFLGDFISASEGGLVAPDDLTYGPGGDLYISSGNTLENSAILRYNGTTGEFKGVFAARNGLLRPYGSAFGPDGNFYVSSFLGDQILRFNGTTGQFVDVFASGNGLPGGLNGPNDLLFTGDGSLYVTTQGSVAVDGTPTFPGLPSQVLRFSPGSTIPTVFVDQPQPSLDSLGFVSFLGLALGPEDDLFVSDFANDIRRYDINSGDFIATIATNYTGTTPSNNFVGSLTFGPEDTLYTVGFDTTNNNFGAILRYSSTGEPLPSDGNSGAIFVNTDSRLLRPIGITYTSNNLTPVPESNTTMLGLLAIGVWGVRWRMRDRF